MPQYRKKPIVVEAFLLGVDEEPDWFNEAIQNGIVTKNSVFTENYKNMPCYVIKDMPCYVIKTFEGNMIADLGNYIIKGISGEIYPCKKDIFEQSYDLVVGGCMIAMRDSQGIPRPPEYI